MLAKIHIAKKQLGMEDADYRAMLDGRYGVDSAGKLDIKQLDDLLRFLSRRGFQAPARRRGDRAAPAQRDYDRSALMGKIEALLAETANAPGPVRALGLRPGHPHAPGRPGKVGMGHHQAAPGVIAALGKNLRRKDQAALRKATGRWCRIYRGRE
jgi:hypothetical protein